MKNEAKRSPDAHQSCHRQIRRGEEGTTLVEMMIVLACFSVVSLGIYGIISQTQISSDSLNAWNSLTQWGQNAVNKMNLEITQGRLIYQNDAVGQAYLGKLEVDASYPVTTTNILPVIDSTGTFYQDTLAITRTGNAFLFVKDCAPYVGNAGISTRRVNIYRLIYYYLSPINKPISDKQQSLRLVRWVSKEFADYNQIIDIQSGITRTDFITNLFTNRNISYTWITHNTPTTAFYRIYSNGSIDAIPDSTYTIQKDTVENFIPSMGRGYASVAWNRSSQFWTPDLVPKFAQAYSGGSGFPHGFEVQIIGPSGGRQILIRLVLAYSVPLNKTVASSEAITIVAMREY